MNPFWWPLDLSKREEEAFYQFHQKMLIEEQIFDNFAATKMVDDLARVMKNHINDIIERDGLPHHCHLINGWGNALVNGHYLVESFDNFVHRNNSGEYFILQCDPEGDFHPWQGFAYAIMAGVSPDLPLSRTGFTLRSLASNSKKINTQKGTELGHLLFALAYMSPNISTDDFFLNDKKFSVKELMELAIEAHHYGDFEVCRKFHLTEGLCAAASKISELGIYRETAQKFLDGQMEMLILLGVILTEAKKLAQSGLPVSSDSLIYELRDTLRVGHLIENHFYYAGHLIELACFAASQGYTINNVHWQAMAFIFNEINHALDSHLNHLSIQDCFLTIGHYRRALSLFLEIKSNNSVNLTQDQLQKYTVNFDNLTAFEKADDVLKPKNIENGGIYNIAVVPKKPRQEFLNVIKAYSKLVDKEFEPRGSFDHFRRIVPPLWPRAFHYEILDYGNKIGIEIHLESESVLPMKDHVIAITTKVKNHFKEIMVEWDSDWYHGYGRLKMLFDEQYSPDTIAKNMHEFISISFDSLDFHARKLDINPISLAMPSVAS